MTGTGLTDMMIGTTHSNGTTGGDCIDGTTIKNQLSLYSIMRIPNQKQECHPHTQEDTNLKEFNEKISTMVIR
jgi:hypothetical protein